MASDLAAMDRLRECEVELNEVDDYKKGQMQQLVESAMQAIETLKAEKNRMDLLLPELQEQQKQHNLEQHTSMQSSIAIADGIKKELDTFHQHTGELCAILDPQTQKMSKLQKQIEYLKLLLQVETISLQAKQETNGNIDTLVQLAHINSTLPKLFGVETSLNMNLRTLIAERMSYLAKAFQAYHTKQLERILDELQWPQPLSEAAMESEAKKCSEFAETFTRLFQLQLSLASVEICDLTQSTVDLWAMTCLTKPIVRRFHYHFDTSKKTNDITKPEWFLTYIIESLTGHYGFIQKYVSPVLAIFSTPKQPFDAMTLFIQALLEPIRHKVSAMLPLISENKPLLCHAIDEIVAFENTLRVDFGYLPTKRSSIPTILDICSQSPRVFKLWMQIDKDYGQQYISNYLQSQSAWECILDDDAKVTNAAYAAASCFTLLKDRFQALSDITQRYEYVIQVLKPFLRHCYSLFAAFAKAQRVSNVETWSDFAAAINSASYMARLLEEWDDMAVFVELLQMAKAAKIQQPLRLPRLLKTEKAQEAKNALLGSASLIVPTAALSAAFSAGSNMWHALHHAGDKNSTKKEDDEEELVLEGSMFESEIAFFKKLVHALEADMLNASVTAVLAQWDRYATSPMWASQSKKDCIIPEVSCEFGCGLELVQRHLAKAQKVLSLNHFQVYWQRLAKELDAFLQSVILSHKVPESTCIEPNEQVISIGGREQLQVDIQSLVDIFRCHTSKPVAYLRGICDACTVLKMENKKAATLATALDAAHNKIDTMEQLTTMLEASHIHALRPSQVLRLLRA